jgi:hypothetical protein
MISSRIQWTASFHTLLYHLHKTPDKPVIKETARLFIADIMELATAQTM